MDEANKIKDMDTSAYAVLTGLEFVEPTSGKRFAVVTCTKDQNGTSWLIDVEADGRGTCYHDSREVEHPMLSFTEALKRGLMDTREGVIMIPTKDLAELVIGGLIETVAAGARRAASKRRAS
jgi:hypothetical protein